jgi:hypothetical protein
VGPKIAIQRRPFGKVGQEILNGPPANFKVEIAVPNNKADKPSANQISEKLRILKARVSGKNTQGSVQNNSTYGHEVESNASHNHQ